MERPPTAALPLRLDGPHQLILVNWIVFDEDEAY
jgi:hypothetical protein